MPESPSNSLRKSLRKEIGSYPLIYISLGLILILGLFVRVYRLGDLLGFYYDQGRDALVIWKFWHEGKPFLIGPVTGLQGIFLGPFYYYLIAPLYLIGGGNPVVPAVFLSFLSTLAIFMLYFLGWKMHSRTAGLSAATVGAFSYYIVKTARWFSNPNPIFLTSLLLLYSMWKIVEDQSKSKFKSMNNIWWIAIALFVGISLHFESASAVFYIPVVMIFSFWQRKNLPNKKTLALSFAAFFVTLLPQIIFNFRHDNILFNNFSKLFFQEKAFRGVSRFVLETRLDYFRNAFASKLYAGWDRHALIFTTFSLSALFAKRKSLKKGYLTLFSIFLVTPMVFYIFFQGNFGNIYDYYMSGYFLPFILLFGIGLGELWKTYLGKVAVIIFFITFFQLNGMLLRGILTNSMDGPTDIKFGSQVKAVDWVFNDAQSRGEFNVDVYVPPVIPHAYDYLFIWQGTRQCGDNLCGNVGEKRQLLYTLFEQDPPHPERLEAWLARQKGLGKVEEEVKYGGITVQRRRRL